MAKKKSKKRRQHTVKPSQPQSIAAASVASSAQVKNPVTEVEAPHLDKNLTKDLKKFSLLAGVFILLEIIIWYVLTYSAVGARVYDVIKL